jgi:uncharacterized protein (DUF1778 family)
LICRIFFGTLNGMKDQKKGRGRPPKSSDKLQTEYLDVRLTEVEKKGFKDAADVEGMPLSAWVRHILRQAATKVLREAEKPIAFLE